MGMDLDKALRLYEEFVHGAPDKLAQNREWLCDDCGDKMAIQDNMWLCSTCHTLEGCCNMLPRDSYNKKKSMYHRRCYFIERMNLLCGYKHSMNPDYKKFVNILRKRKFSNVRQLKRLMREVGANKFYKFVYNIFYEIKKKRIVNITQQRITMLAQEFVVMESFFKQKRDAHNRKNLFSYSAIMYMLLKRHNIKGYKHVLLPNNSKSVFGKIANFCGQ